VSKTFFARSSIINFITNVNLFFRPSCKMGTLRGCKRGNGGEMTTGQPETGGELFRLA
jgi:hypothetical protein